MACSDGLAKLSLCGAGGRVKHAAQAPVEGGALELLQLELAHSYEEHRTSISKVSEDLSVLNNKLANAESSMLPWSEVAAAKQHVADMQTAIDEHINDAKQKQEGVESSQGILDVLTTSREVRDMQEGVINNQRQRRKSLSEVSESLVAVSAKLDSAEASWSCWGDVNDAKQQVADIQNIVGQQVGVSDGKQQLGDDAAGQQDETLQGA